MMSMIVFHMSTFWVFLPIFGLNDSVKMFTIPDKQCHFDFVNLQLTGLTPEAAD